MKIAVVFLGLFVGFLPCYAEEISPLLRIMKRQAEDQPRQQMDPSQYENYYQGSQQVPQYNPSSSFLPSDYPVQKTIENVYPSENEEADDGEVVEIEKKMGEIDPEIDTRASELELSSRVKFDFDSIFNQIAQVLSVVFPFLAKFIQSIRAIFLPIAQVIRQLLKTFWTLIKQTISKYLAFMKIISHPLRSMTPEFQQQNLLSEAPFPIVRQKRDTAEFVQNLVQGLQGVLQNEIITKTVIRTGISLIPGFIQRFPEVLHQLEVARGPVQVILLMIEAFMKFVSLVLEQQSPTLAAMVRVIIMIWTASKPLLTPFIEKIYQFLSSVFKNFAYVFTQQLSQIPNSSYNRY